jgi:hypothetical protein
MIGATCSSSLHSRVFAEEDPLLQTRLTIDPATRKDNPEGIIVLEAFSVDGKRVLGAKVPLRTLPAQSLVTLGAANLLVSTEEWMKASTEDLMLNVSLCGANGIRNRKCENVVKSETSLSKQLPELEDEVEMPTGMRFLTLIEL